MSSDEEIEITFSYWDGSGHRKTVKVKIEPTGTEVFKEKKKVICTVRSNTLHTGFSPHAFVFSPFVYFCFRWRKVTPFRTSCRKPWKSSERTSASSGEFRHENRIIFVFHSDCLRMQVFTKVAAVMPYEKKVPWWECSSLQAIITECGIIWNWHRWVKVEWRKTN